MPPTQHRNQFAPPDTFRITAEFEPASAVIIGYTYYYEMLNNIAKIASNE